MLGWVYILTVCGLHETQQQNNERIVTGQHYTGAESAGDREREKENTQ